MSTTDATDPVTAILDILDASTDDDYSTEDAKPDRIARADAHTNQQKRAYHQSDALYIRGGAQGGVEVTPLDGRETAPLAATPRLFLQPSGEPRGFFEAVVGGRSGGTPGTRRG